MEDMADYKAEKGKEGGLWFIILGGLNIVGKWLADGELEDPRLYVFNAKEHGFVNFPGSPDRIFIKGYNVAYPLESGEIEMLYIKQVSKITLVQPNGASHIVSPDGKIIS